MDLTSYYHYTGEKNIIFYPCSAKNGFNVEKSILHVVEKHSLEIKRNNLIDELNRINLDIETGSTKNKSKCC